MSSREGDNGLTSYWGVVTDPEVVLLEGLMGIVNHHLCKQTHTMESPPPSCFFSLICLSYYSASSCSAGAVLAPLQCLSVLTDKYKKKKWVVFVFFPVRLHLPSVLRNTLPRSVPPESCCPLSAGCSWAEVLPPPPQMALAPKGTPGLVEESRQSSFVRCYTVWS